jgi:threonine synthase
MKDASLLTHLECGLCGLELEADRLWNLCPKCGKPLLARYDLRAGPDRSAISAR